MSFNVDDPAAMHNMTLRMKYDDAFVAYINGTEVARANFDGTPAFDSTSTRTARRPVDFEDFVISEHIGLLRPGENVLAVHAINRNLSDRDMLVLPALIDGIISVTEVVGIPHAQEGNPRIQFDGANFDVNPVSGNQDEEYIKLDNPNDVAVDVSGWRLTGGVQHTFRPGTVIPAGGSLYVTPSVRAFLARTTGPSGDQELFVQGNYDGRISNAGETTLTLQAFDYQDQPISIDSITVTNSVDNPITAFLRVTEINYNPHAPTSDELALIPNLDNDDFEFVELKNVGSDAIQLVNIQFTDGIEFTFSDQVLEAGQTGVLVKNHEAFSIRYGKEVNVLGQFTRGSLNNAGERLALVDGQNHTILDIEYGDADPWPEAADGLASTLVLADAANTSVATHGKHYAWRSSTSVGGSPGEPDASPAGVVINELIANTEDMPDQSDAIELHNPTGTSIDIGGWFLSDSGNNLLKFEIPCGYHAACPSGTWYLTKPILTPTRPIPSPNHFGLSGARGDDVWLVIPDRTGGVASIVDEVHFGAATSGVSLGRAPNGLGRIGPDDHRKRWGMKMPNPRSGPVLMSEVQYHPGPPSNRALAVAPQITSNDLEYVELRNSSASTIDLGQRRIRGGVDIDFDAGTTLDAGATPAGRLVQPPSSGQRRSAGGVSCAPTVSKTM